MDPVTIISLLGVGVVLFFIISFIVARRSWHDYSKLDEPPIPPSKSVLTKLATAVDKKIGGRYTGSYKVPTYHQEFQVLFRLYDGTEEWIPVPEHAYEKIPLNTWEDLLIEDGQFLDFGGRFGDEF